jgi:flagellar hook-associated protein 2
MSTITSLGIGSGLDIASLVSQLVKAEGDPATTRLNTQQQTASAQLSALGTLKSSLSSLQTSLKALSGQTVFQATKASSSQEALFTVSASAKASAGQYQVEVQRLAERHKLGSDSVASTQTFGGSAGDQLVIAAGSDSFTLDLSAGKTLSEIRDGINAAADNPGITASLIQVDDTRQVLMLTAADTGSAKAVSVTETLATSPSLSFDTKNLDAKGVPLANTALLDSLVKIDGIDVTRAGNQLTDVIEGLTIDLHKAEEGTRGTLSVSPDQTSAASAVSTFVGQYNALVDTLTRVSGYKGADATQPALFGDATTRGIASRLRVELGRGLSGLDGAFSNLSQIGIRTGTDGKLTLDATALNAALAKDSAGVSDLFASTDGFATRINGLIETYIQSGGVLEARTKGAQGRLDRIDDAREILDRRLTALEARYKKQFTAMDTLVGQLQSTSSFLTQQFAALSSNTSSTK